MRNNRLWILGCSILTVAILALGVLLGISPRLIEAQDADAQRQQVASNNAALRIQTAALKEQYENIDDLRAQLEELSKEVPADASLDDFFDELSALAIANGISVDSYTGGQAQHYSIPSAEETTSTVDVLPLTNPLITPENLLMLPVNLSVSGSLEGLKAFLGDLQRASRLVLVQSINLTGSTTTTTTTTSGAKSSSVTSTSYTASITGFMFALLAPGGTVPTAEPTEEPTATPTPTETPTASPTPTGTSTVAP